MKIDVEVNYAYNKILDITECYYVAQTKTLYFIYKTGVRGIEISSTVSKISAKSAGPFVDLVNSLIQK